MGQLEDLWVPRSAVDVEVKRRKDAEKRLAEVLRYLDPQPKGGPIYAAPYPEPGDLGQRMVALVERWEALKAKLSNDEYVDPGNPDGYHAPRDIMHTMIGELRKALGEHAKKGTEKPAWLCGPPVVKVYTEEGGDGMCIESILVKAGLARDFEDAHDLIGSGVVRIEETHVVESHWRGADQEFTLFVGDGCGCRIRLTSEPEPKVGILFPEVSDEGPHGC